MHAAEILLQQGLLNQRQVDQARQHGSGSVLDAAIALRFVTEDDALRAIGQAVGLDYADLSNLSNLDNDGEMRQMLQDFPQKLIYRQSLFPIRRFNGSIVVATSDPFDLYPLDEVSAATGLCVTPVLASRHEIAKLIKKHLGVGGETVDNLVAQSQDEDEVQLLDGIETDGSELCEMAQEASVVRLVNEMLLEAIETRASDVHIESQPSGLVLRYRVDGMLHPQPLPPEISRFESAIVSRLKIMSRLNIAEKRLPQDGRIKLKVRGREVDVRVSVIPMIHGESIVMRILDKGAMRFDLRSLGMDERTYEIYRQLIDLPHGIVLVTGPTGSGKTTTLYSSLLEINKADIKIVTTEDPVEYQLEGINQIQVHSKIGLTFAQSLRSILRHDPDVVLVGEIRDLETAENAIQASLTGHLVFSTLHTNDAAGAYTRLVDMGVEPFLVSSTVEAVMAQRLVRRLCEHCKQPYRPVRDELPPDFPWEAVNGEPLFRPGGCRQCRSSGYSGRVGIYELLVTTEEVRRLAHENASSWDLKKAAVQSGMTTLRMDGWKKVVAGATSVEEVARVTKGDRMVTA
ncbi:MAG: GspE/PulE family protein [Pirellulaceae bacterium]|nr:GspE/PulE family protein [Pirellulaceae bacterium]